MLRNQIQSIISKSIAFNERRGRFIQWIDNAMFYFKRQRLQNEIRYFTENYAFYINPGVYIVHFDHRGEAILFYNN